MARLNSSGVIQSGVGVSEEVKGGVSLLSSSSSSRQMTSGSSSAKEEGASGEWPLDMMISCTERKANPVTISCSKVHGQKKKKVGQVLGFSSVFLFFSFLSRSAEALRCSCGRTEKRRRINSGSFLTSSFFRASEKLRNPQKALQIQMPSSKIWVVNHFKGPPSSVLHF